MSDGIYIIFNVLVNIDSEHNLGIREFSYGKFWKNGLGIADLKVG